MTARTHRRRPRAGLTPIALLAAGALVALIATLLVVLDSDGGDATAVGTATTAAATPSGSRASTPAPAPSPSPSPHKSASSKRPSPSPTAAKATRSSAAPRAASGTASLAGRIRPGTTYRGIATFYDTKDGDGACTYGPAGTDMTAAMNTADYEASKACGAYVRVHAASGASITVRITNICPAPCAPGQLDLSPQAFAKLAAPVKGQIPITWTLLSPPTSQTISLRYKTGSSRYWCGIQAIGHRNPLARLEVRTSAGWRSLPRATFNYFLAEDGTGCGSAIRLTDIYGQQLTAGNVALRAGAVQPTGLQFGMHS
ncbi:expansin EXLX1 family cellulose-binding protein [Streptomyces sp. NPDC050738]|uniref:expansin EXLX1 family cellulose-binding protein n=1 Tax=Streptomyces sp. NPDC050738 TaxID=3154744 RepID=UPI003428B71E